MASTVSASCPDMLSGFASSIRQQQELLGAEQFDGQQFIIQPLQQNECSMCGDVGLQEHLFQCIKCRVRHQHTYCSPSYPNSRCYSRICNWCDTDGMKSTSSLTNYGAQANTNSSGRESCDEEVPATWRNELEMLLAAAEVLTNETEARTVQAAMSCASGVCKTMRWSAMSRRRGMIKAQERTKLPAADHSTLHNIARNPFMSKCKHNMQKLDSSTCMISKRIGRRYKCLLDV